MNKKLKLQEDLTKLTIQYESLLKQGDAEQERYYADMRKHNIKLNVYRNKIAKIEEEVADLNQFEKEEKYSVEEIELAKNLLKNCGYIVAKI